MKIYFVQIHERKNVHPIATAKPELLKYDTGCDTLLYSAQVGSFRARKP